MEPFFSRTKIICTMGPACANRKTLLELANIGLDVCRINCSHANHEIHQQTIDLIRSLNDEEGLNLPILLDLQGPKIRVGKLDEPFPIHTGDIIKLSTGVKVLTGNILPMEYETFAKDVNPGDLILVDDGKIELRVVETNRTDTVTLEVIVGDQIMSRKGVNLPDVQVSLPSLSEKDLDDLEFGIRNNVEWVALSFVRKASDVTELKELLKSRNSSARVIAKIEKPEALRNIDEIIEVTDAIMIARGDLGVEIPTEEVPMWQKIIIRKCNAAARPVIVATQMLESMIENKRPTRAEATDVANAVLDGADCVMLSAETSTGKYPVEVVRTMQRIISIAEQEPSIYHRNLQVSPHSPTFLSDATCVTAVKLAIETKARALVGMTRSGYTAYQLAKCRPMAHIFIFTDNPVLINTMSLVWGVRVFYYDRFVGTNESIQDTNEILKTKGLIQAGDVVINCASMPLHARKRTNMTKVTRID